MAAQISPLIHIEIVVHDAEKAYQFLHEAMGAEKVQEEFAAFLDGEGAKVIHVGLGDVVLQFIQPLNQEGSWYEQLRDKSGSLRKIRSLTGLKTSRQEESVSISPRPANCH